MIPQRLSILEQIELLKTCIQNNLDLGQELSSLGLGYDDLRYRYYDDRDNLLNQVGLYPSLSYRTPQDYDLPRHQVPTLGFFSGGGGLELGFEYAGFNHLASIEINKTFCDTLRQNKNQWTVIGPPDYSGDVHNRGELAEVLRNKIEIQTPFEGVFHGGPPCQPFSIASNQRFSKNSNHFKRTGFEHSEYGNLLFDFIWYIQEFKPRVFLIENVVGLLTIDRGQQLRKAIETLRESGYKIVKAVLNAADYGVPQQRHRLFVVGSTKNHFDFPSKEYGHVPCIKALEKPLNGVENHVTRQHKAQSIIRYMELRYGERDRLGRVDRLKPNLPSKTVIAGGTKGGGRSHLQPQIPRTLSVRESARLQTFPDNYIFSGVAGRQFTQVGNAVPPLLALKLAKAIYGTVYRDLGTHFYCPERQEVKQNDCSI